MASPPFLPDQTKPGDSDVVSQFPTAERTFRDVIESWLLVDHDTSGFHAQVTLPERGSDPTNDTDTGFLYTKDDGSGNTELFYEDDDGNVIQLTSGGVLNFGSAVTLTDLSLTGEFSEAKGADVASAATTDIWTPGDGNYVHITGTNTITSLGTAPQAGAERECYADAAFTLTDGANLVLPGGADITAAAGDVFTVRADTTTKMVVTKYTKADGTAVATQVFSESYDSGDKTFADFTVSHGLSSAPKLLQLWAHCQTAEYGYNVGDYVLLNPALSSTPISGGGVAIQTTATQIIVSVNLSGVLLVRPDGGGGSNAGLLTAGNWNLVVRAWA